MLNKIIEFSIKNKLIIGLFMLALIGYGVYEVRRLPIDAVPDITNNQVQVITTAPALGAPDVERLITFPIEQVNNNIPGLLELRSFSRFGLSVVTIVFDDNTDIYWARQQVAERLQQAQEQIPKGFGTPVLAPVTTGLGEIYQYSVRPKKGYENKYNAMELRTIQDWIVRRQLLGVKGVAEVSSFGGLLKQYEIAVTPEKLMAYNITIGDVFSALEKNNQNTGGAYIEKGPTILFIRSEGLVGNMDDIQNIVVKNLPDGTPLLIRDIAEVHFGNAPRYGAMTYNGQQQVSGAVVMMLKGANSNEVIKNIKQRIAQIEKTLPEGVTIDPFLDRTKMVNNAISTVTRNLMEGALIVIFVLVLFLGNLRAGLLVASVIPLSMLFAIILMNTFGVSGNLMSLGALDFGLIVDGAVIIVEAVMHKLSHSKRFRNVNNLSQPEMDKEVQTSASGMMNSAVFGQIIILIVYLPIFTLEGIEGKMFKPMAQTVAFALLGAFILSLTYIPMMSTLFLSKKITHKQTFSDRMMGRLERFFQKYLTKLLRYQKAVLATVLGLFVAAAFVLTTLGGEFIPSLPEGDFAVDTRVLPGSNLNTSIDAVSKASKIILEKFPEVEKVVGKTGSSEVPTDPMAVDASDMMIILKPRSEWTSAQTYPELEAKISKELEAVPGVSFGFQYPVAMRFNELISGARQDVVCKIFGENLDTLASYANKLGKICNTVKGSEALYVEAVTGMPQIVVKYNRAAIAQYGMNISDINRVVNAAFAGESSGMVYEGEKRFDLVVRLTGDKRKKLEDVQHLLVATPQGTQIPLSTVASVDIEEGLNQIQRENSQRRIIVGFNVRGRDIQSTVHELQQKVQQQIKLPPGYYITYGGAFENLEAAKQRLYVAVPVSLVLIFLLLFFAFRSVKQGLLIYTSIPLSAIGGIFALAIRGISFSVSAGIGFIALFGVAVLNGIVLLGEFNRLKKEGYTDLKRIVIMGTKTRLRPVLMTAFVASLGFLPMALSHGEGAEVQRPLATVVIGGLLIATFLTLFVLPILYMMFNKGVSISKKATGVVSVLLLLMATNANAQIPITLQQAIDTALTNNRSVKNERLKTEYRQKLIQSGTSIPATQVFGEYGQINSFYKDTRLGISQTINFPTVYKRQKELLNEEWKSSVLNVGVQEAQLKKQVAQVFYTLVYLQQKKALLQKNDTLFAEFLDKATLRFNKGESNVLEKTTAENQRGQIRLQLSQLEKDIEILQLQFQLLLNTETVFVPSENAILENNIAGIDTATLAAHPAMQFLKQQQQIAQAATKMERSKLSPDLTLGYNITGMKGMGADDKVYNSTPRFQAVQVGLGIPIFTGGQKAKINAAKINEEVAAKDYELNLKSFEAAFASALKQYQKYQEAVAYFENTALKNSETITTTANKQFLNGDINYLEWALLIGQSVSIKSDYIEAVKSRNSAIAELNFYLNK
ncbi:CusA/CzcA family heavy metal efflux RND transporter [Elizabethkingia anophelis]|nr:CusA/CzcA family heavy metal efflux RND transporter [Terrimonas sp.]MDV3734919.1 CusA/CzcA family heavy metal efflux RND transporter [Elizabethkingia anophelis]MDV3964579.1 CusA/CzcA family heavy metal efflux RND transporter [Elizabethkingia anophelis]OJY93916.1 MAG: acriflavine resistance protein B [Sphingobacteriales bacterium 40-81]